jgi:hypothetical protein
LPARHALPFQSASLSNNLRIIRYINFSPPTYKTRTRHRIYQSEHGGSVLSRGWVHRPRKVNFGLGKPSPSVAATHFATPRAGQETLSTSRGRRANITHPPQTGGARPTTTFEPVRVPKVWTHSPALQLSPAWLTRVAQKTRARTQRDGGRVFEALFEASASSAASTTTRQIADQRNSMMSV